MIVQGQVSAGVLLYRYSHPSEIIKEGDFNTSRTKMISLGFVSILKGNPLWKTKDLIFPTNITTFTKKKKIDRLFL